MDAKKCFNNLVKQARKDGFTVGFFKGEPENNTLGTVFNEHIKINSGCDVETRLNTLLLIMSIRLIQGNRQDYIRITDTNSGNAAAREVARFALHMATALQAG